MARLPANKRLRSATLGANITLATTVDYDGVAMTHIFQDDVAVIALQIGIEFLIMDAHVNADGMVNGLVEVSRQGTRSQPGSLGRQETHAAWTATQMVGGETRKITYIPFPDGTGWEFDEGEGINLLALAQWIGAGGPMSFYPEAIIFYVER
ncbi:hypothetical protein ES703_120188 [subsurface metagenome]